MIKNSRETRIGKGLIGGVLGLWSWRLCRTSPMVSDSPADLFAPIWPWGCSESNFDLSCLSRLKRKWIWTVHRDLISTVRSRLRRKWMWTVHRNLILTVRSHLKREQIRAVHARELDPVSFDSEGRGSAAWHPTWHRCQHASSRGVLQLVEVAEWAVLHCIIFSICTMTLCV